VAAADIILHVRDVSHPDTAAQREDVLKVLTEMADGPLAALDPEWEGRVIEVLNKADLLGGAAHVPGGESARAIACSALTGEGVERLLAVLDERLAAALETVTYAIPAADGARLAWLYRHGEVIERAEGESGTRLTVRLTSVDRARFEQPSDD